MLALLFRIRQGKTWSKICNYSRFSSRKKETQSRKCDRIGRNVEPCRGLIHVVIVIE